MPTHDVARSVPAFFTINNPVEFDQMEWILKDQTGQFKTDLVLDAIAKAENIQVGMEDVDAELTNIAMQNGAKVEEVKKIISSNGNMGLLLANILRRKSARVVIDGAAK